MIHFFNRKSIYIGNDMKIFGDIRQLLAANHIRYTYRVKNQMGQWAGHGTLRAQTGSMGQLRSLGEDYEVFVHKKDYDEALYLLQTLRH